MNRAPDFVADGRVRSQAQPLEPAPISESDVRHALRELDFPASVHDILEAARDAEEPAVAAWLADLLDHEYESLDHLVDALRTTLEGAGVWFDPGLEYGGRVDVLCDINQADVDQLESIEGIDRELAERIIQVREAMGGFRTVDDLISVGDLDPETLERLRRSAAI